MITNISSRKNEYIRRLRENPDGEIICVGGKMLDEALKSSCRITSILWKEECTADIGVSQQYVAPADLFDYACPQVNSPGPVFTVELNIEEKEIRNAVVLENVQDPGNVGTVIRTANALSIDAVYLVGDCATFKNPKTVRATMGAVFHEKVFFGELPDLPVYGAALTDSARDIREVNLANCAVAVGSEGKGLSREMLDKCVGEIIIPMSEDAESLNAAVAASICMWQMVK